MDFPYLENAMAALEMVEEHGLSLDDALDAPEIAALRRSTANLLFAFFRHKCAIESFLKRYERSATAPPLRRLLKLAAAQMRFQSAAAPAAAANAAVEYAKRKFGRGAANFANFFLHRVAEAPENAFAATFPEAVMKRWRKRFSAPEIEAMRRLLEQEALFSFRACGDFRPVEPVMENPQNVSPVFRFHTSESPGELLRSDALRNGGIYIQDPAAALAPSLASGLAVSDILDLCGAPGGKSLLLRELFPEARFTITDRSESRQKLTRDNAGRHRFQADIITAEAWALPAQYRENFDLVLADVPCSNTGVFRRRCDALYRFSENSLREVRQLQTSILAAAADYVRPGKYLIYSTCSIEPEENELAAAEFIAARPDFEKIKEAALTVTASCDGAYACLFRKRIRSQAPS